MASLVLSTAGSAVGGSVGGPIGALLGARLGQSLGGAIDQKLFGGKTIRESHGARLGDLAVQTSTYGKMIPLVYGTVRIAGNVIWSRPIREVATTTTSSAGGGGGKGGGGRVTQSNTTYSYYVSMAVAISEGPLDEVYRIWADAKQLDLLQYTVRIYKGTETQLADSYIQGYEGADFTPAYRGLAYVVFEDFPLADFGNRIPNFTFEVKKKAQYADYNGEVLENVITGMTMIPGAGEYVYDTAVQYKLPGEQAGAVWAQAGQQVRLNMHNYKGIANSLLSLDQLQETCPNVEWVSVVCCWFGDTMDAATCVVKPGVEYQTGATTPPDTWSVAGFTRATAKQILLVGDAPQYGGTPDDDSILRYLDALIARGYKIMFYPMMFMDVPGKPWRGELTGSAANVASFFTKTNGYNAFITHYANMVASRVDAFVIGSELVGLTKVSSSPGVYPAVNALVSLAATVKGIVGSGVKVTYAADWSEYHHTTGGWYNLDPLWASSNIDMIGIDAYFPLTDEPQGAYNVQEIIDGWGQGEGYDWYYSDPARTVQTALTPAYAWKNIGWFWSNTHTNPDASTTSWVPGSKKIWFTEYGFPSVDGAANQPNVFYDPDSTSSALPYYSKGRVDFRAQRAGLMGTEMKWAGSSMVERKFIWTWDARPYPYWPDLLDVWADGRNWKTGHWVQGKLGISSLAAILAHLCQRSGLAIADFDVSQITDQVEGFVVTAPQSIRETVEQLQQAYFFDAVESDGVLKFVPRGGTVVQGILEDDLVPMQSGDRRELLTITRAQEIELPKRVNAVYLNRLANYQPATQYAQREVTSSRETMTLDLPIVFGDQVGKIIADKTLYLSWVARTRFRFDLPMKYARLEPTDVVQVTMDGVSHRMRIVSVQLGRPGILRVEAMADDVPAYDFYAAPGDVTIVTGDVKPVPSTSLELLDLPAFPTDAPEDTYLRMAATGVAEPWNGAVVYRSDDGGSNYQRIADMQTACGIGAAVTVLADGAVNVFDEKNTVTVSLLGVETLQSVNELAVLNGANAAVLGEEIIQFRTATLVSPGKYTLSGLLRGRLGTEYATVSHLAGERFVLLDGRIGKFTMSANITNLPRKYKPVTVGGLLSDVTAEDFTYAAVALKPYSPVQITGTRDGSGNITLNWIRRTRLGGEWQDYVDVPLNETSEKYEVDIMNGVNVVRIIGGLTATTASYSAANQVTDFGSTQSSLTVRVYQLSERAGRGRKGEAAV